MAEHAAASDTSDDDEAAEQGARRPAGRACLAALRRLAKRARVRYCRRDVHVQAMQPLLEDFVARIVATAGAIATTRRRRVIRVDDVQYALEHHRRNVD